MNTFLSQISVINFVFLFFSKREGHHWSKTLCQSNAAQSSHWYGSSCGESPSQVLLSHAFSYTSLVQDSPFDLLKKNGNFVSLASKQISPFDASRQSSQSTSGQFFVQDSPLDLSKKSERLAVGASKQFLLVGAATRSEPSSGTSENYPSGSQSTRTVHSLDASCSTTSRDNEASQAVDPQPGQSFVASTQWVSFSIMCATSDMSFGFFPACPIHYGF